MSNELLRQLPSVDRWLTTPAAKRLCESYPNERVKAALRMELADLRRGLSGGLVAADDRAAVATASVAPTAFATPRRQGDRNNEHQTRQ